MLTLLFLQLPQTTKKKFLNWFNAWVRPHAWHFVGSSHAESGGREHEKTKGTEGAAIFKCSQVTCGLLRWWEVCRARCCWWVAWSRMPWKVAGQCAPCGEVEIYFHSEEHYCWPCLAWENLSKHWPNKSSLTSTVVLATGAFVLQRCISPHWRYLWRPFQAMVLCRHMGTLNWSAPCISPDIAFSLLSVRRKLAVKEEAI